MPRIVPATSERNFTPSWTALSGPLSTTPGTVLLDQIVRLVDAAVMVMLSAFVVFCAGLLESLTCAVKLKVPAALGVPVIAPLFAFRFKPAGRAPATIDHEL